MLNIWLFIAPLNCGTGTRARVTGTDATGQALSPAQALVNIRGVVPTAQYLTGASLNDAALNGNSFDICLPAGTALPLTVPNLTIVSVP